MDVRLTEAMIAALRETPEMPDNLLARVNAARTDRTEYVVSLTDDEAMALTEMCQWYIRRDPVTGTLGPKAKLFEAIVNAVYEAGG
jgi:hypothetical protein